MGSDGYPVLVGADETSMNIIDKALLLTSDTNTCFVDSLRPVKDTWAEGIYNEGRAVIMTHCISYSSNIYKLTFEYGVLPNPKYTEQQESYYSMPDSDNGSLMAGQAVGLMDKIMPISDLILELLDDANKELITVKNKLA